MSTKTNLWVDIAIFVGFLVAYEAHLTGIAWHEWLSIALTLVILLHLVLHWDWIVQVGKRFFHKFFHSSRLDFVVDALLFVMFVLVMVSGIAISRSVLAMLGLRINASPTWRFLHSWSANLSVFLLALHFALHWKWIVNALQRVILRPAQRMLFPRHTLQPATVPAPDDNGHEAIL